MDCLVYTIARERNAAEIRLLGDATSIRKQAVELLDDVRALRASVTALRETQLKVNTRLVPVQAQLNLAIDMHRQIAQKKEELYAGPKEYAYFCAVLGYDVLADDFEISVTKFDHSGDILPMLLFNCYLREMQVQNGSAGQKMLNFTDSVLNAHDFLQKPVELQAVKLLDAQRYRLLVNKYLSLVQFEIAAENARTALWSVLETLKTLEKRFETDLGDCFELGNFFQLHLNRIQFDVSRLIETRQYGYNMRVSATKRHMRPVLELAYFAEFAEATLESISALGQYYGSIEVHEQVAYAVASLPQFIYKALQTAISRMSQPSFAYSFSKYLQPFVEYIQELLHRQFRLYLEQCKFATLTDPRFSGELAKLFGYLPYREIFVAYLIAQMPETCTSSYERELIDYLFVVYELFKQYDTFYPILGFLLQKIDAHIETIIVYRYLADGHSAKNVAEIAKDPVDYLAAAFNQQFVDTIYRTIEVFESQMHITVSCAERIREFLGRIPAQNETQ